MCGGVGVRGGFLERCCWCGSEIMGGDAGEGRWWLWLEVGFRRAVVLGGVIFAFFELIVLREVL